MGPMPGGTVVLKDGFLKGREVNDVARRLKSGGVRELVLKNVRVMSTEWGALCTGVMESHCLHTIKLTNTVMPIRYYQTLQKWSKGALGRALLMSTEWAEQVRLIPNVITDPTACTAAVKYEIASLKRLAITVPPDASYHEAWAALSFGLQQCRDEGIRYLHSDTTSQTLGAKGVAMYHHSVACGMTQQMRNDYSSAWMDAVGRCLNIRPNSSYFAPSQTLQKIADTVVSATTQAPFTDSLSRTLMDINKYLYEDVTLCVHKLVTREILPIMLDTVSPTLPFNLTAWVHLAASLRFDALHPRETEYPLDVIAISLENAVKRICVEASEIVAAWKPPTPPTLPSRLSGSILSVTSVSDLSLPETLLFDDTDEMDSVPVVRALLNDSSLTDPSAPPKQFVMKAPAPSPAKKQKNEKSEENDTKPRRTRGTRGTHSPPRLPLRFKVGDRVQCTVAKNTRSAGKIVALWENGKPYKIKLDSGGEVYANKDTSKCVIGEATE